MKVLCITVLFCSRLDIAGVLREQLDNRSNPVHKFWCKLHNCYYTRLQVDRVIGTPEHQNYKAEFFQMTVK